MKILFATDGSSHAQIAEDLLQRMPLPDPTELTLLTVVGKPSSLTQDATHIDAVLAMFADQRRESELKLQDSVNRLANDSWKVNSIVREGHPAHEILEVAKESQSDLIILGARGLTALDRFVLGSISEKVMRHAECSVLIAHEKASQSDDESSQTADSNRLRILLALDGSPSSHAALETIASLPLGDQVEVTLVTVMTIVKFFRMDIVEHMSAQWQEEKAHAEEALKSAADRLRTLTSHVTTHLREAENVSHEIHNIALESNTDLIVVGHQGMSAFERVLLGSISERVVRHAPCSVLVVR